MMEGNNLAELRAQIHAPVIDTGLFSCALCFCLLVIDMLYISITTYHMLLKFSGSLPVAFKGPICFCMG